MFLIEFKTGEFVDAEKIDYIKLASGNIEFTVIGDMNSMFTVDDDLWSGFLNHLQALNGNISSIDRRFNEIRESYQ